MTDLRSTLTRDFGIDKVDGDIYDLSPIRHRSRSCKSRQKTQIRIRIQDQLSVISQATAL
jgi:hypothetical protein